MGAEIEQIPEKAKTTFTKVLAAIGCGFYSYSINLVEATFALFTKLYKAFQSDQKILEHGLKWFLNINNAQMGVDENVKNMLDI